MRYAPVTSWVPWMYRLSPECAGLESNIKLILCESGEQQHWPSAKMTDQLFSSGLQLRSSAAKRSSSKSHAAVLEVAERFLVYFAERDGNESKTWVPAGFLASLTPAAGLHDDTCWKKSNISPTAWWWRRIYRHVTALRTSKPCVLYFSCCAVFFGRAPTAANTDCSNPSLLPKVFGVSGPSICSEAITNTTQGPAHKVHVSTLGCY